MGAAPPKNSACAVKQQSKGARVANCLLDSARNFDAGTFFAACRRRGCLHARDPGYLLD